MHIQINENISFRVLRVILTENGIASASNEPKSCLFGDFYVLLNLVRCCCKATDLKGYWEFVMYTIILIEAHF